MRQKGKSGLRIAKFSRRHAGRVADMEKNFPEAWSKEDIARCARDPFYRAFAAFAGDEAEPVGFCCYYLPGGARLLTIIVKEDMRGQGVGFFLLGESLSLLAKEESRVTLEVRKSNRAAIALYEKAGFTVSAIRKNLYSRPAEDGLVMTRNLTGNF